MAREKSMPKKFVQTWLYHKLKGGKIHALHPGTPLPKGWRDMPWPEETPVKEKPKAGPEEAARG